MKRAYKITPVSMYDIRGLESWLEDMAKRGLVLKRLRAICTTFERGPARSIRYRVEPFRQTAGDGGPPQAMLDLYQDFGWSYVCDAIKELLVFSTEDETAPEPHSDPGLQAKLWKKLYRSKLRMFFFELAVTLLLLFGAPYFIFEKGTPVLTLLTTTAPILIVYLLLFLAALPGLWADAQQLGLTIKQLEAGVPLNHRSFYPRRRWREIIVSAMVMVLFIAYIVVQNILPLTGGRMQPLRRLDAFPLLSLAEVEGEKFNPHSVVMSGKDYANFCRVNHYLLCPNQWRAVQTGETAMDGWIRMEIQWYDLPDWLSGLSAPLSQELFHSTMGLDDGIWWTDANGTVWTADYLPYEGVSFLAVACSNDRSNSFQLAAAACRDKVVLVKYTGGGDLGTHLDKLVDMVR